MMSRSSVKHIFFLKVGYVSPCKVFQIVHDLNLLSNTYELHKIRRRLTEISYILAVAGLAGK